MEWCALQVAEGPPGQGMRRLQKLEKARESVLAWSLRREPALSVAPRD